MGRVVGTAKRIVSERALREYGRTWPAHADEVLAMLGVERLPDEGMPEREIQGVRVYVAPKPPRDGRHMQRLRVMAICACGRHVAVGRLHQHICR